MSEAMTKSEKSLSARRAWIEIAAARSRCQHGNVALRKESVDRNMRSWMTTTKITASLSARRAWIEISRQQEQYSVFGSLSARRAWIEMPGADVGGAGQCRSLSARRAWIEISRAARICRSAGSRSPQGERG